MNTNHLIMSLEEHPEIIAKIFQTLNDAEIVKMKRLHPELMNKGSINCVCDDKEYEWLNGYAWAIYELEYNKRYKMIEEEEPTPDYSQKFKAGTYFVGDPCYVIRGDKWQKLLDDTNCLEDDVHSVFYLDGVKCYAHGTAFGDGEYDVVLKSNLTKIGRCGVDSGMIGIIPMEIINVDEILSEYQGVMDYQSLNDLGHVYTFTKDFNVSYAGGVFDFKEIMINTEW
jgi:hypothetical protein